MEDSSERGRVTRWAARSWDQKVSYSFFYYFRVFLISWANWVLLNLRFVFLTTFKESLPHAQHKRWDVKDMFLDLISQILMFLLVLCELVLFNEGFFIEIFFKQYAAPSTEAFVWPSFHFHNFTQRFLQWNRHLVSSVGIAPVCWAGGRGFKPQPDQHSGSLNNREESAAFIMTSSNGYTF